MFLKDTKFYVLGTKFMFLDTKFYVLGYEILCFRDEIYVLGYEILCFWNEIYVLGYEIWNFIDFLGGIFLGMKFRFRVSDEILTSANFATNRKTENFVTVSKIKISLLPRNYKISSLLETYKNPLFRTKNTQKHQISSPKIKKIVLKK